MTHGRPKGDMGSQTRQDPDSDFGIDAGIRFDLSGRKIGKMLSHRRMSRHKPAAVDLHGAPVDRSVEISVAATWRPTLRFYNGINERGRDPIFFGNIMDTFRGD